MIFKRFESHFVNVSDTLGLKGPNLRRTIDASVSAFEPQSMESPIKRMLLFTITGSSMNRSYSIGGFIKSIIIG